MWLEHGAIEFREKLKKGETVLFSWIKCKNRPHRDRVNKKLFTDKRLGDMKDMPFDPKRMAYGGFKTLVKA